MVIAAIALPYVSADYTTPLIFFPLVMFLNARASRATTWLHLPVRGSARPMDYRYFTWLEHGRRLGLGDRLRRRAARAADPGGGRQRRPAGRSGPAGARRPASRPKPRRMKLVATAIPGCFAVAPDLHTDPRGGLDQDLRLHRLRRGRPYRAVSRALPQLVARGVLRGCTSHCRTMLRNSWSASGEASTSGRPARGSPPTAGRGASPARPRRWAARAGGVAHGFSVVSEDCVMCYATIAEYAPLCDVGVRWDSVGASWPERAPLVSQRDAGLPPLSAYDSPFIYTPAGVPAWRRAAPSSAARRASSAAAWSTTWPPGLAVARLLRAGLEIRRRSASGVRDHSWDGSTAGASRRSPPPGLTWSFTWPRCSWRSTSRRRRSR